MEPLKEMFNKPFYERLGAAFAAEDPSFDKKSFIKQVTKDIEALSLNERMRNTSVVLHEYVPKDFKKSVSLLKKVIPHMHGGYTNLLFPDYVGMYGLHDVKTSLAALKYFTSFGSSEFAIRVFLKHDLDTTLKTMYRWAEDENHHVRRLASEGSRPRLPWSFKLDAVIKNPVLTKPILEMLKADKELYVKKSVANHLNDLSKDATDYMLAQIQTWDLKNKDTAWIVKHACRNLIKKGDPRSLSLFSFEKNVQVRLENLALHKNKIRLNETLEFSFDLISEKKASQKLVVDYAIHYAKKGGEASAKVFKLKELELAAGQKIQIVKKQVFKDFTTRKHYAGKHVLEIQVNGKKMGEAEFVLAV